MERRHRRLLRKASSRSRFVDRHASSISLLVLLAGTAGLSWFALWFLNRADTTSPHLNWPTAEARVVRYRIMNWAESRREGANFIEYWAEYRLRYEVDGKSYELWWPTDIVSRTRSGATGEAAHDVITARFVVRYDPKHPWNAEASRK